MPRVMKKPKFKPHELVTAFEPFTGTLDGAAFVANPSDVFRGDAPVVRAYPWMFRRQGDKEALAEYRAGLEADDLERRAAEREGEAKRAAQLRRQVQDLADRLEPGGTEADGSRTRNGDAAKTGRPSWPSSSASGHSPRPRSPGGSTRKPRRRSSPPCTSNLRSSSPVTR
jgi:hypothetical protein